MCYVLMYNKAKKKKKEICVFAVTRPTLFFVPESQIKIFQENLSPLIGKFTIIQVMKKCMG
jgi:hypothetical protein